jgi:hypothetical protein
LELDQRFAAASSMPRLLSLLAAALSGASWALALQQDGKLLIEGSLEELRTRAGAQGQSLEDVFLSLTAQPAATPQTAAAQ